MEGAQVRQTLLKTNPDTFRFTMLRSIAATHQPPRIHGYSAVSTQFAGAARLIPSMSEREVLDTEWKLHKIVKFDGPGSASIEVTRGGEKRRLTSYCKVTHILDPIRSMQGYYSHAEKGSARRDSKLQNPNNQAYVDAIACVALSKVREMGLSPHFCLTYGVYRAVADCYRWNITDDFDSYRKYKNFWAKRRAGFFTLHIERDEDSEASESSTTERLRSTPESDLHSRAFTYHTVQSFTRSRTNSHESLENLHQAQATLGAELVELESLGIRTESEGAEILRGQPAESQELEEVDFESELDLSDKDIDIYSEMKQFPVMIIFQEHMDGTMDDLLLNEIEESEESETESSTQDSESQSENSTSSDSRHRERGRRHRVQQEETSSSEESSDEDIESRWIAWTFQVIAAVCQMNGLANMVHNDLHTNNIVYAETNEKYLYYRANDGRMWRVPTYGILFRIIDFGRSIYKAEGHEFISDDFAVGGDAEGQYNYGPIFASRRGEKVEPNPSFDLCRFALSVIEVLFSEPPAALEDGRVLNREVDGWEQKETVSPLFNMLWSWIVTDSGENVLRNSDGSERYPSFELYPVIASQVHSAVPADQLGQAVFDDFRIEQASLTGEEKVYKLYC
jgi:hypothetical protein